MAESDVQIINSALIKIGEETITSRTQDTTAARAADKQFDLKRDELIALYRWNFAIRRVVLAKESAAPVSGFASKFKMPADALRIIGIFDGLQLQQNYTASEVPFQIEADRFILADGDALSIFYLARITDVSTFPPAFSEALAWFLASDLAFKLSTGPRHARNLEEGFERAMKRARLADAIEGSTEIFEASEWLDSRRFFDFGPFRAGPITF